MRNENESAIDVLKTVAIIGDGADSGPTRYKAWAWPGSGSATQTISACRPNWLNPATWKGAIHPQPMIPIRCACSLVGEGIDPCCGSLSKSVILLLQEPREDAIVRRCYDVFRYGWEDSRLLSSFARSGMYSASRLSYLIRKDLFEHGQRALAAGKYEDAEHDFDRLIKMGVRSAGVYTNLGVIDMRMGKLDSAFRY